MAYHDVMEEAMQRAANEIADSLKINMMYSKNYSGLRQIGETCEVQINNNGLDVEYITYEVVGYQRLPNLPGAIETTFRMAEILEPISHRTRRITGFTKRPVMQLMPVFEDDTETEVCNCCKGTGQLTNPEEKSIKPNVVISHAQMQILSALVADKFTDGSIVFSANQVELMQQILKHGNESDNVRATWKALSIEERVDFADKLGAFEDD